MAVFSSPHAGADDQGPALVEALPQVVRELGGPIPVSGIAQGQRHDLGPAHAHLIFTGGGHGCRDQAGTATQRPPGGQMSGTAHAGASSHDEDMPVGVLVARGRHGRQQGQGMAVQKAERAGAFFPDFGRHGDGAHMAFPGIRTGPRQHQAGLGGGKADRHVRFDSLGTGQAAGGIQARRYVQGQDQRPGRKFVHEGDQTSGVVAQLAGKTRAQQPVHQDVGMGEGRLRQRGHRKEGDATCQGRPKMIRRFVSVMLQRPGMENMRAGSGIKQITGKAGGIAAIVAAAHEQPDLLFRKPGAQGAQLAERRGRGIFHQDLRQDAQFHGLPVPLLHLVRQGQRRQCGPPFPVHRQASSTTTAAAVVRSCVMDTWIWRTPSCRARSRAGPVKRNSGLPVGVGRISM